MISALKPLLERLFRACCLLVGRLLTRFPLDGRPEEEVGLESEGELLLLEGLLVEAEEEEDEAARVKVVSPGAVSEVGFEKLKLNSSGEAFT